MYLPPITHAQPIDPQYIQTGYIRPLGDGWYSEAQAADLVVALEDSDGPDCELLGHDLLGWAPYTNVMVQTVWFNASGEEVDEDSRDAIDYIQHVWLVAD
jgi:hypothetical protein